MQHRSIHFALVAAVLLGCGAGLAADKGISTPTAQGPAKNGGQTRKAKPVDINRASAAQLKTVPGIGDAEAERIIKGRPYPTKAHLVTEKILTYEAYVAMKDRLVAIPIGRPTSRQ